MYLLFLLVINNYKIKLDKIKKKIEIINEK